MTCEPSDSSPEASRREADASRRTPAVVVSPWPWPLFPAPRLPALSPLRRRSRVLTRLVLTARGMRGGLATGRTKCGRCPTARSRAAVPGTQTEGDIGRSTPGSTAGGPLTPHASLTVQSRAGAPDTVVRRTRWAGARATRAGQPVLSERRGQHAGGSSCAATQSSDRARQQAGNVAAELAARQRAAVRRAAAATACTARASRSDTSPSSQPATSPRHWLAALP